MPSSTVLSDVVVLRGGLSVPLEALQLAWRLEDSGCHFRWDGNDLLVGPRASLTADDRAAIQRWSADLKAVIRYCDAGVEPM